MHGIRTTGYTLQVAFEIELAVDCEIGGGRDEPLGGGHGGGIEPGEPFGDLSRRVRQRPVVMHFPEQTPVERLFGADPVAEQHHGHGAPTPDDAGQEQRVSGVRDQRRPQIEGFFEAMSIAENLHMGLLAADLEKSQVVSMGEMKQLAGEWTKTLSIRAIDSNARVIELSGGNQQKVVISKSLLQKPKIVIFDEPTRGVDVGAIAEIHQLINGLADDGLAIIVISSYLPEILNISDGILVCRSGRVVEEFSPEEATEEKIMYAAVH